MSVREWLFGLRQADVALFYRFRRPPYGGANQFMLALRNELRRQGYRIAENQISNSVFGCIFNSFNFDFQRLRQERRPGCRMIHRVDGPIAIYRGWDDGTDDRIRAVNAELADATVFQSQYSLDAHRRLGLELRDPTVIMNTVDPAIFHPPTRTPGIHGDRVRLIATAWSDNPNKGAATFAWLDKHLDWRRYSLTFVGRTQQAFNRIRVMKPRDSRRLAQILREHDIYIAASVNDPCSNALLEALACGLPTIYVDSGGHPEIVGSAGLGFREPDEIAELLDHLVGEYAARAAAIQIPTIHEVASRYLQVMGIEVEQYR